MMHGLLSKSIELKRMLLLLIVFTCPQITISAERTILNNIDLKKVNPLPNDEIKSIEIHIKSNEALIIYENNKIAIPCATANVREGRTNIKAGQEVRTTGTVAFYNKNQSEYSVYGDAYINLEIKVKGAWKPCSRDIHGHKHEPGQVLYHGKEYNTYMEWEGAHKSSEDRFVTEGCVRLPNNVVKQLAFQVQGKKVPVHYLNK